MKTIDVETIDKFAILQEVPVFEGVPVDNLWSIAEKAIVVECDNKFPFLIEENKTEATYFYILLDGVAILTNTSQELETLTKNSFYGEKELIAGKENYLNSIRLISPQVRFLRISKRLFLSLFENFSDMSKNLCRFIAGRYLSNSATLAKEMEKNRNIDLILNRFNKVSNELLKAVGREEVELKFLLKDTFDIKIFADWGLKVNIIEIDQAYLKIEGGEEERIRKFGNAYYRTIKQDKADKTRDEKEFRITKEEFEQDYKKVIGTPIKKTRYQVQNYPEFKELCVDIYEGKLEPLKVAEIEYWTLDDAATLERPEWLNKFIKKDVTTDQSYKNKNLSLKGLPK